MQQIGQGQGSATFATTGPRLCVVSNDQKGRVYPLTDRLAIGRGATNEIVTADPRASRVHATIEQRDGTGRWGLTDPGSTNGTFVNGQRVGQIELRDGDLIQIGDFALVVELRWAWALSSTTSSGPGR